MDTSDWKKVKLTYDPKENIVYIGAPESAFVPAYLNYMLEYLDIPKDAKRIFQEENNEET
jgi:hypothetical protein